MVGQRKISTDVVWLWAPEGLSVGETECPIFRAGFVVCVKLEVTCARVQAASSRLA